MGVKLLQLHAGRFTRPLLHQGVNTGFILDIRGLKRAVTMSELLVRSRRRISFSAKPTPSPPTPTTCKPGSCALRAIHVAQRRTGTQKPSA